MNIKRLTESMRKACMFRFYELTRKGGSMQYDEELSDFLDDGHYEFTDVMYGDKPHTAVEWRGDWLLFPVNFKFLDKAPYLDYNYRFKVSKEVLDGLQRIDLSEYRGKYVDSVGS